MKNKIKKIKSKLPRGSVLVFTLIILFIILASAIGISSVSVLERKGAHSSDVSVQSFQIANSGAEIILKKLKCKRETDKLSSIFSNCNISNGVVSGSIGSGKNYAITFYKTDGLPATCSDQLGDMDKIKSVGSYSGTTRAIEVAFAVQDSWKEKAPMPTARDYLGAAALNGKIYAIGGQDADGKNSGKNEVYDPANNSWKTLADMPTPRYLLKVEAVNEKLYAFGGFDSNDSKITEEYDPSTDKWTSKSDMNDTRFLFASAVIDNYIYAIGGQGSVFNGKVERYDPSKDKWENVDSMPVFKSRHSAAVANGKIYAITGDPSVLEYDPVLDSWSQKQNFPDSFGMYNIPGSGCLLVDGAAAAVKDKIYHIGGSVCWSIPDNFEYDPVSDKWYRRTWMLLDDGKYLARHGLVAVTVNDKIYVMGGAKRELGSPYLVFNINQEYNPAADCRREPST